MNRITLCGRLVEVPEIKYSSGPDGVKKAYARYRIAVSRRYKKQNEKQPKADFFSCVCFGSLAEFAGKYFRKGERILIAGRVENDPYTRDGQTFYNTKVIVEEHEFADSKKNDHENASEKTVQMTEGQQQTATAENSMNDISREDHQELPEEYMPSDIEIPFR